MNGGRMDYERLYAEIMNKVRWATQTTLEAAGVVCTYRECQDMAAGYAHEVLKELKRNDGAHRLPPLLDDPDRPSVPYKSPEKSG